jgi:hypothetical protein
MNMATKDLFTRNAWKAVDLHEAFAALEAREEAMEKELQTDLNAVKAAIDSTKHCPSIIVSVTFKDRIFAALTRSKRRGNDQDAAMAVLRSKIEAIWSKKEATDLQIKAEMKVIETAIYDAIKAKDEEIALLKQLAKLRNSCPTGMTLAMRERSEVAIGEYYRSTKLSSISSNDVIQSQRRW